MRARRRWARRRRMLVEEVSGMRKMSQAREAEERKKSGQIVQRHPSPSYAKLKYNDGLSHYRAYTCMCAYPPIRGPSVGPQTALMPQMPIPYARFLGSNMSAMDAPPVASAGEPKNPERKRRMK